MSRKRYITSAISTDEQLSIIAEKNPTAALMWPWICTAVDDWGRMDANPVRVKLEVFPAFPFTSSDIAGALQAFHDAGLAVLYEVNNRKYLAVNPWTFYKLNSYIQTSRKERDESKIPAPEGHPFAEYWQCHEGCEQEAATSCNNLQEAAQSALSPSPSPSGEENPPISPLRQDAPKRKYAENVSMTEAEYQKLVEEFGEADTARMIQILDDYKGAKGKRYKSDYRAIRVWVVDRLSQEKERARSPSPAREDIWEELAREQLRKGIGGGKPP